MPIPSKKPGEKRFSISYNRPTSLGHTFLFARDEEHAKKVFKTYVGQFEIVNIVQR